jgi:homoserine dehydrogenase
MSKIGVAVIGFGTIGSGVVKILQENRELIRKRTNVDVQLKYVVDVDWSKPRDIEILDAKKSSDYKEALADKDVDVVIELVGGIDFAYKLTEETLKAGKNVVTANKALLAERGEPLFELANKMGKSIGFEGSVAGGIPIIRTVTFALAGEQINAIYGILNGTTNYILTKMLEEGMDFKTALKQAQQLGFAEADPTLDIEGVDAAHKISILSSLAFNNRLIYDGIHIEGITKINLEDVRVASEMGYVLKLLGISKIHEDNTIELRVNPTLVPKDYQLASVRNEFNAVLVDGKYLGRTMYYGRGAGSLPTATAVVGDVISIARFREAPIKTTKYVSFNDYKMKPIGEIESRYYIRFNVVDRPGVLSKISGVFGENDISIASVLQEERSETEFVPLIMTTHTAKEKNIKNALDIIEKMDFTKKRGVMLRIME